MIRYGAQSINQADIDAVVEVLKSDYLTTGLKVAEFEEKFAKHVGAKYAVAVSSGTAALHAAMFSIGIEPGDEVLVPAITFVATANAVVMQGGTPVFVDVDKDTMLMDESDADRKITNKTSAVISVDYAGQYCDVELGTDIWHISDACHSFIHNCNYNIACYSFHPTKNMTTGEGGMITTGRKDLELLSKDFRDHGRMDGESYSLGYNYRLSDIHCALGISQLDRLDSFVARRQEIAKRYDEAFKGSKVQPLKKIADHNYHLYVIKVNDREAFRERLASNGIGTQVHYKPLTLESLYNQPGTCPVAEKEWKKLVSIPIYPSMTDDEVQKVIEVVIEK